MKGESVEQVEGELESVTSSAGCFVQAGGMRREVDSSDLVMHSETSDC